MTHDKYIPCAIFTLLLHREADSLLVIGSESVCPILSNCSLCHCYFVFSLQNKINTYYQFINSVNI